MTEAEAMQQVLDGAPPGTVVETHRSAWDDAVVVTAQINKGPAFELARIPASIHHDPLSFHVDWPAIQTALPGDPS